MVHNPFDLLIGKRATKRHKNGTFGVKLLMVELIESHDVETALSKIHILHTKRILTVGHIHNPCAIR